MDIKTLDICLYLSKTEAIFSVAMSQVLENLLVSVKRSVFVIFVESVQSLTQGLVFIELY